MQPFPQHVTARKKIIARINGKRNSKSIISVTTNAIFYFFGVETIVEEHRHYFGIRSNHTSYFSFFNFHQSNRNGCEEEKDWWTSVLNLRYHVWECNARKSDRIYPIYREFILLLATSIDSHQTSNTLFQNLEIFAISQFTPTFLSFVVRGIRESKRQYDVL